MNKKIKDLLFLNKGFRFALTCGLETCRQSCNSHFGKKKKRQGYVQSFVVSLRKVPGFLLLKKI